MLNRLRESGRLRSTVFLLVIASYCVVLTVFRVFYTHTYGYVSLNWNLFLAFLPWMLTSFAVLRNVKNRVAVLAIMAVWLLFFPNCLYILTDLIHLSQISEAPIWLDLIILLSFAWGGLCFGFTSLMDIEYLLKERFRARTRVINLLSVCMIYVASFGIYIGRFWRWNSWDIFGNPAELMHDVFDRFADGGGFSRVLGFTILMGTLLNLMYLPTRSLRKKPVS